MLEFYQMLQKLDIDAKTFSITVLEGAFLGQKALVSDGEILWTSKNHDFFSKYEEEVKRFTEVTGRGRETRLAGTRVFCELLGRQKKLVICGGGHVSMPIIEMGRKLGFYVTVLEDRPKFADHARRAGADRVICDGFSEGLAQIPGDRDTFFIIVTRGHTYDRVCLEHIIEKPHAYIGMMGSRKRVEQVKESILSQGADPDVIAALHTPIGLAIGAETPEEIAISVLAQIIQVKNRNSRGNGYSKELMSAILNCGEEPAVLATIVGRKGSAPRSVGTKMLVLSDGNCVDTIGGGCVEAEIVRKALLILRGTLQAPCIVWVDMTGQDAEEEGMVCGGTVEVLLEEL